VAQSVLFSRIGLLSQRCSALFKQNGINFIMKTSPHIPPFAHGLDILSIYPFEDVILNFL
jgi:hypothetical protein